MPYVNANDVNLYYETVGEGFPLLLIAGFTVDHSIWNGLVELLSGSFKVIIFDNRGCGQSDCPDAPYTIETMANDAAHLLKNLQIENAHILGHSMGAAIAQIMAINHSELIRKIVLANPFPSIDVVASYGFKVHYKLLTEGTIPVRNIIETRLPWLFSGAFLANQAKVDDFIEMVLAYPFPQSLVGYQRQFEALRAFDSTSLLSRITALTFILASERDLIAPPHQAQVLAKGIPNADILVVPAAAHLLPLEKPEFCAKTILDFLLKKT